jgi:hypothetical protein
MQQVMKVPHISEQGDVEEVAGFFGGAERLKEVVDQL